MNRRILDELRIEGIYLKALILCVFAAASILISCGSAGKSETPEEKLDAYCVRECVLETGDSEVCDTRCGCASKKLSDKLTPEEFAALVGSITEGGSRDSEQKENLHKFKNAFGLCKSQEN